MFEVYDRGDAVLIRMEVKKWVTEDEYEYYDPDSIKITITKNSTKKVDSQDMAKDSGKTGYYYYIWQTVVGDDLGEYDVVVVTTIGSYSEKNKGVLVLR